MATNPPPVETDPAPTTSVVERLLWFVVGPAALVVLAVMILNSGSGWLTALDVLFFVAIAVMIWSRWADIRSGHGRTAYNEPATSDHFRRYVAAMLPLTLGVWVIANVVGNHLM